VAVNGSYIWQQMIGPCYSQGFTHFKTHGWSAWQPMCPYIWQQVIGPHGTISFVHMVVLVKLTIIYEFLLSWFPLKNPNCHL